MSTNPLIFLKILAETKATSAVIPEWVFGRVLSSWKATPAEKRPTEVWELSHCTEIYAFGGPIQVEAVKEFFNAFNATGLKLSAFRVSCVTTPRTSYLIPISMLITERLHPCRTW